MTSNQVVWSDLLVHFNWKTSELFKDMHAERMTCGFDLIGGFGMRYLESVHDF